MDLSTKEQNITLAALTKYLEHQEQVLASDHLDEDDRADTANDATLLEILIARFEAEVTGKSKQRP